MDTRDFSRRKWLKVFGAGSVAAGGSALLAACGDPEVITEEIVVKEEVIREVEVVKEVPVEKIVIQTEVVEKLVTEAPVTPKNVTLRLIMLSMNEDTQLYFDELALPDFLETHPGYKVDVDLSTWGNLGEKMLTSFAGNIPVDVVQAGADWIGPYAIRGQFISLAPFTDSAVYAEELSVNGASDMN